MEMKGRCTPATHCAPGSGNAGTVHLAVLVEGLSEEQLCMRKRSYKDVFASLHYCPLAYCAHALNELTCHTPSDGHPVELAQTEYQLPRLTRMWTHLDRVGGGGAVKGTGVCALHTVQENTCILGMGHCYA
eukprot:1162075-Pelagomonas_calceolata.AAC.10